MTQPLRLSLVGQTVDALRELVLTGEIAPGARVNEVGVSQRLGISRGPLREAIRALASEGLLEIIPNRGARVPIADPDEVRALFELRGALECTAAAYAAMRRTDADLKRLRTVATESRINYQAGEKFPYRLDLEFHQALLDAARSPRIAEQVRLVQQKIVLLRSRIEDDPPHQHASLDDHDDLVDAIEKGEAEAANVIMQEHLSRVCKQMLAALPDEELAD